MVPTKEELQRIVQALRSKAHTEEFKLFLRYLDTTFQYRLPQLVSSHDINEICRLQGELKTYGRLIGELTRPEINPTEGV